MKDIGALSTATFFFSLCMHLPHQVCLLHFSIVENTKHGIRIMLKKKRPTKSARPLFTILRHERNLKDKRTQSLRILTLNPWRMHIWILKSEAINVEKSCVIWKLLFFRKTNNFSKLREALPRAPVHRALATRATDRSGNNNFAKQNRDTKAVKIIFKEQT